MKIISISNIKGGVGKTTTAATLGAGLAEKGYSVLLVDSDPQTNLTMCYLHEQDLDDIPSLYHVYANEHTLDEVKNTIAPNLDLVTGDFELCNADMQFTKVGRLKILKKALEKLKTLYDFIIIDTPPNLGILSLNAFFASDYVIVPMSADSFSLKGVRLLKQALNEVEEDTKKEISVAGLLLTRYTDRTNVSKLLENSFQSIAAMLNTTVFDSRIRQAIVIQESQVAKMSVLRYASQSPVAHDYRNFIDELLKRIEV